MTDTEQRKLGLRLIKGLDCPELREAIRSGYWGEIMAAARPFRDELLPRLLEMDIPSEWAHYWALYIGNRELMRDRVTDPEWAFYWACNIGDQDVMRARVTEPKWKLEWGCWLGREND